MRYVPPMEKAYSFIGEFACRADAKNRIVLPSAFKRELEGETVTSPEQSAKENDKECGEVTATKATRLVIKKDIFEQCLLIYPYAVWEKNMDALRQRMDPYNRRHSQFLREYQRNTCEAGLDANGRLLLPQRLLDLIGASKELTLLGIDDHVEVWDSSTFASQAMTGEQLGELADSLFGGER